jgi:hypothetical protein
LMRKLVGTKFEYLFENNETPTQYCYHLMGQEALAKQNTYSIMYSPGRMASFDAFMEWKFGKFGTMPEHVKGFGYDPDATVSGAESSIVMIDIGGGKGRYYWRSRMLIRTCHLTVLFYKTTMLETRPFRA